MNTTETTATTPMPKTSKSYVKDTGTQFKRWCIKKGITQHAIRNKTGLSIGCIHNTWNDGTANDSTVKLLFLVFGRPNGISETEMRDMIHKQVPLKNKFRTLPEKEEKED